MAELNTQDDALPAETEEKISEARSEKWENWEYFGFILIPIFVVSFILYIIYSISNDVILSDYYGKLSSGPEAVV
jgi:hypothetical protein